MPAPSASADTGSVSSGGVLSTQRRQSARRRCRAGRGGLAAGGSAKSPRACRAPPWPRPERFLGRHLQPPERAAVSRPEARSGSRPRFPPEPNIVGLRPNVFASPCAPPSARGGRRTGHGRLDSICAPRRNSCPKTPFLQRRRFRQTLRRLGRLPAPDPGGCYYGSMRRLRAPGFAEAPPT